MNPVCTVWKLTWECVWGWGGQNHFSLGATQFGLALSAFQAHDHLRWIFKPAQPYDPGNCALQIWISIDIFQGRIHQYWNFFGLGSFWGCLGFPPANSFGGHLRFSKLFQRRLNCILEKGRRKAQGRFCVTSRLSITSSLTQRKNMFSPWLSFSFLEKWRGRHCSFHTCTLWPNKSKNAQLGSGWNDLPEKIEVLQGFSRIGGLKFARVEHQKSDKIQAPDARRVTGLMAHYKTRETKSGHGLYGFKNVQASFRYPRQHSYEWTSEGHFQELETLHPGPHIKVA